MIRLFDNQEQLIKIVRKDAIRVLKHKQILTDENYISDQLFVEMMALDEQVIQDMEFIAIPTQEDPFVHHLFFIAETKTEGNITTVTGVQSGIEELRKIPVYDQRPQNQDVRIVVERLLEGTNWRANYVADGKVSTNFYYISVFEALKKACLSAGVEMQFFVEVRSTRIGARYIDFKKRTGKDIGKRVVYGHNALKIVKEDSKTNLITALIGRGKGEQVSSGEENESGQAGYGRKITFKDVVWRTSEGKPLNKPAGQEYLEDSNATLLYGIKTPEGNRPKIGFVEFQDVEDPNVLIQLTYEKLLELNRPQVLMKTDSLYLTETGIGDTIRVVRPDRNLDYKTRVFEIEWDRLTNASTDMKLGDKINSNEQKRQASMMAKVAENLTDFFGNEFERVVNNLPSADGFSRNYYTDTAPENPKIGDLWFKPDPREEGKFIILTWNGEMWEEIISQDFSREIRDKFDEFSANQKKLEEQILAEESRANQAIADANFKTLEEAKSHAEQEALTRYESAVAESKKMGEQIKTDLILKLDNFTISSNQLTDAYEYRESIIRATNDSINQLIINGSQGNITNINSLTSTVHGMQHLISDPENIAREIMTSSVFQRELSNSIGSSIQTQMANSFSSLVRNNAGEIISAINQTDSMIGIRASKIFLDGDTFARQITAQIGTFLTVSADNITSGTLNAYDVRIVNLDARSISSGTLSGINMHGGVLTALNGASRFDLNNGTLEFYTDFPAIRRVTPNQPNQFVQFGFDDVYSNDGTQIVRSSSTAIGSNRWNNNVTTDGGFAGLRIFNSRLTPYVDRVQIIADLAEFTSSGDKTDYQNNIWMKLATGRGGTTQVYPSYHTDEGKSTLGRTGNPWTNLYTDDVTLNGVSLKNIVNRLYGAMGWGYIV